jgi:putative holliday junction resolvase
MARILALDYGIKRTGVAVTDEMQIIATGLTTVETPKLFVFLEDYFKNEKVEKIVLGEPKQMDGSPSESAVIVEKFKLQFEKKFPNHPIVQVDERFTSKMAFQSLLDNKAKKKHRQNKGLLDEIAATIILQDYLQYHK